jgi:hypothetical protein
VAADGQHDGHARVDQLLAEIFHLADAGADVVVVHRLDDAAAIASMSRPAMPP